jgi:signal transduction histidine kinase
MRLVAALGRGIGVAAGCACVCGLGADTDDEGRRRWDHAEVKAAHARALTLGATGVWVLPMGLVGYAGAQQPGRQGWPDVEALLPELLAPAACLAAAWLIVRRVPTSPTGPALAWIAGSTSLVLVLDVLTQSDFYGTSLRGTVVAKVSTGLWPLDLVGLLALLLVFPDGLRSGRIWRLVPWVYAAATLAIVAALWDATKVGGSVDGGPTGGPRLVLLVAGQFLVAACLVAATMSLVLRYRSGDEVLRLRVRWLMLAGVAIMALLVAGWVMSIGFGVALGVAYAPVLVAVVVIVPAAVTVAIVRHDLFDIDRLLSQSTAWTLTLTVSAAIFGIVVLGVSEVVSRSSGLDLTAAAFVTALVLLPLHRYVGATVARIVDRDRFVAVTHVEGFAADVRAGRRDPEEIEAVLREAHRDPNLRLVLAEGGRWVDLAGAVAAETHGLTLTFGGDAIARLVSSNDTARGRRRLTALSRAAAVPIEVCRLRLGLRASRARLVEAADAERRRLERDLHDGAQQRLIATGMRLRMLQRDLDPIRAAEIDRAIVELESTVAELRELAHGVRPSRLDDGLVPALEAVQAATPIAMDLDVSPLPVLDDVQVMSAYLVVSEAVTNSLKHAHATRVGVRVADRAGRLFVEVSDDGVGGVPLDGALTALRDRVESVGGTITVSSPSGAGTTVTATL